MAFPTSKKGRGPSGNFSLQIGSEKFKNVDIDEKGTLASITIEVEITSLNSHSAGF
jgi:hypothetical protein